MSGDCLVIKNPKVTFRWHVVQIFDHTGKWIDVVDDDLTRSEARTEMTATNCYGCKARIVERVTTERVVDEKDFR
jgi:hypothetical protein